MSAPENAPPANPIIIIPARRGSTRLPDKPLADIHGAPLIVHVWRSAADAGCGPVLVACDDPAIAEAVTAAGGLAVMTGAEHASGSDRIHEALQIHDPAGAHDAVVNLQGEFPQFPADLIRAALAPLADPAVDIATAAAEITVPEDRANPNAVKAAVAFEAGRNQARALYFSRAPVPWTGAEDALPLYHHIGIYAYRREALERYVSLPPSPLERRERLEQLRALEAGMRIEVALVDRVPFDVNTPADLDRARALMAPGRQG